MSIYYLFIGLPIIVVAVFTMIFQSSLIEIGSEQYKANCPLPIYEGVVTVTNGASLPEDLTVEYTVAHNLDINGNITANDQDKVGSFFECGHNGDFSLGVSTKQYGLTAFNTIHYGWTGYTADWINTAGFKAGATLKSLYLLINAPAEVTQLAWFSLINLMLFALVSLGGFMMIRGSGG